MGYDIVEQKKKTSTYRMMMDEGYILTTVQPALLQAKEKGLIYSMFC